MEASRLIFIHNFYHLCGWIQIFHTLLLRRFGVMIMHLAQHVTFFRLEYIKWTVNGCLLIWQQIRPWIRETVHVRNAQCWTIRQPAVIIWDTHFEIKQIKHFALSEQKFGFWINSNSLFFTTTISQLYRSHFDFYVTLPGFSASISTTNSYSAELSKSLKA